VTFPPPHEDATASMAVDPKFTTNGRGRQQKHSSRDDVPTELATHKNTN